MPIKPRVLFTCSENSCRTQMAEAFLRERVGDELEIVSAGNAADSLDSDAVSAMLEAGIDISSARTKVVDPYLRERFQYVIALCERVNDRVCPIFPGAVRRQTWPAENPAELAAKGVDRGVAVRHVRDEIRRRVDEFVRKHHRTKSGRGKSAWN